jgi:hypothetical protein
MFRNPMGLHGLLQGWLYFSFSCELVQMHSLVPGIENVEQTSRDKIQLLLIYGYMILRSSLYSVRILDSLKSVR